MRFFTITKTLLKSLFFGPATEKYPFAKKTYCDRSRGSIAIDIQSCIFCGLCQRKCPTDAIVVSKEEKTWTIDRLRCITCGACVEVCPKKCLAMETQYTEPSRGRKEDCYRYA
jgi:formate hydrogenlyase subunit 6/NADH:ubiquinone oxidoreductase subunit I